MAALPHAVHILPDVLAPVMRADEFSVEMFAALDGRLTKLADDLLWWTNTLSAGRAITD